MSYSIIGIIAIMVHLIINRDMLWHYSDYTDVPEASRDLPADPERIGRIAKRFVAENNAERQTVMTTATLNS